jgi:hypothetical protein
MGDWRIAWDDFYIRSAMRLAQADGALGFDPEGLEIRAPQPDGCAGRVHVHEVAVCECGRYYVTEPGPAVCCCDGTGCGCQADEDDGGGPTPPR